MEFLSGRKLCNGLGDKTFAHMGLSLLLNKVGSTNLPGQVKAFSAAVNVDVRQQIRDKDILLMQFRIFQTGYLQQILVETDETPHECNNLFLVIQRIRLDYVYGLFETDKTLLGFISKNLSWGIFKNVLMNSREETDVDFREVFLSLFNNSDVKYQNPEVLIFMIVEFVSSTAYSSILYGEPLEMKELRPYLDTAIRQIINGQRII